MEKPLVAVQMIVFAQKVQRKGYAPILSYIEGLGVREVELSKVPVNRAVLPELEALLTQYGLHACSMNAAFDATADGLSVAEDFDEIVECANRLKCGYVRIGSLPYWVYGKRDMFLRYAEQLNAYGKRFAGHGIRFYHHHHEFEFQRFGSKTGMELLMENTDPAFVGFELDTHWLQYAGMNPIQWIGRLQGRADLVHLKDYRIVVPTEGVTGEERSPKTLRKKDVQFAEIGTGNLDMPGIIQACIDTKVRYMPIEQDTSYLLSPYESTRISVENIRAMGFADCF